MSPSLTAVLHYVQRLAGGTADIADTSAKELLERFLHRRDEHAFALLVHHYGPLVLGTCRRLLGNSADADDAFQATFIVLARRAAAIRRHEALAGWLHGTAVRVCQHLRAADARRRHHERRAAAMRTEQSPSTGDAVWDAVVDEEVARLPERYRAPVVLCYLEGMTNAEAAGLRVSPARRQAGAYQHFWCFGVAIGQRDRQAIADLQ
jgi:RNA polymerase sigma factor (sigma-70 family)